MKKILAIDDKQDNLISLKALLKNYMPNCSVVTAMSGKEGVALGQSYKPDVILLDIIMPEMDGYAVCKELKNNIATRHIPVIMITAIKTDVESRVKGMNLGADAFLSKPIDPIELSAQVNVMLRIKAAEDKLREEKRDLESIVSDRTEELRASYDDLMQETKRRNLIEKEIKLTKAFLDGVINAIADPVFVKDENRKFFLVNDALCKVVVRSREELLGAGDDEMFSQEQSEVFQKIDLEVLKTGKDNLNEESLSNLSSGEVQTIITHKSRYTDPAGNNFLVGVIHNITKRKLTEDKLKESEEKFRLLYDNAPLPYHSLNANGCFVDVNKLWLSTLGYNRDEVIGAKYINFLHPDTQTIFVENFPHLMLEGSVHNVPFKLKHKNGNYIDISLEGRSGYNADGSFKQTYCVFQDVTKRLKAEENLLESEKRYKDLVEMLPEGIIETDADLNIIYANERGLEMTGYSEDDIKKGLNGLDFFTEESRERALNNLKSRFEGKEPGQIEYLARKKDGTIYPILFHANSIIQDGKFVGLRSLIIDITERKLAEEEIRESEERFRHAITYAPYPIMIHAEGKVLQLSDEWTNQTGYSKADIPTIKEWTLKAYGEDAVPSTEFIEEFYKVEKIQYEGEWKVKIKDGSFRLWDFRSSNIGNLPNASKLFISMALDVTERKQAEEKKYAAEKKYRELVDLAQEGIWAIDKNNATSYVNPSMAKMLGYSPEEMLGKSLFDFMDEAGIKLANEKLERRKAGIREQHDFEFICKDGNRIIAALETAPILDKAGNYEGALAGVIDITERKQAEKLLRQRMSELEIFNDAAVDRELMINDLRKEINDMFLEQGKEPVYEIFT